MKCWRYYNPHGSQSLRTALMNSCNPVFMGIALKIGKNTFYNYLSALGVAKRTGVDVVVVVVVVVLVVVDVVVVVVVVVLVVVDVVVLVVVLVVVVEVRKRFEPIFS